MSAAWHQAKLLKHAGNILEVPGLDNLADLDSHV
jgi:hypothetical protein